MAEEEKVKQLLPQELTPPASETMPSEEQDARRAEQMTSRRMTRRARNQASENRDYNVTGQLDHVTGLTTLPSSASPLVEEGTWQWMLITSSLPETPCEPTGL